MAWAPRQLSPLETAQVELSFLEAEISQLQSRLTQLEAGNAAAAELNKVYGLLSEKAALRMVLEDKIERLRPPMNNEKLKSAMDKCHLRITGLNKVVPPGSEALPHISAELLGLLRLFMEAVLTQSVRRLIVNDLAEQNSLSLEVKSSSGFPSCSISEPDLALARYIGQLATSWQKDLTAVLFIEQGQLLRVRANKGKVVIDHYLAKRSKTIDV